MELSYVTYILLMVFCCGAILFNRGSFRDFYLPWLLVVGLSLIVELVKPGIPQEIKFLVHHLYQPTELTLLLLMYGSVIRIFDLKKILRIIIPLVWVIALSLSTFLDGWNIDNVMSFHMSGIIIVCLSMLWFYQLFLKPQDDIPLLRMPYFYINTANLFFFAGTYFYIGLKSYVDPDSQNIEKIDLIMKVLNYMLYSLYLIGALCRMKKI